jgi:hypothetical protein
MLVFLLAFLAAFAGPMDDVQHLVELSPRVAGSPGGYQAQGWVLSELKKQGWDASMRVGPTPGSGFVQACQTGTGPAFWVLAHTDTVAVETPGAVDNAVAVAVALEVARKVRRAKLPTRVCFGFPDGEELGLHGSRYLAKSLGKTEQPVFVISLELLGQGRLSAMGIGKKWGVGSLRWLNKVGGVSAPYAYRVYATLFPSRERSDHKPFADAGIQSMMLLGRGKSGVYWAYHTPRDTLDQVDPNAVADAIHVLLAMLQRGPPPAGSGPALTLPWVPLVLPGFLVWLGIGIGVATGFLVGLASWRSALGGLGWASAAGLVAGLAVLATGFDRPLHGAMAGPSHLIWLGVFFWVILLSPLKRDGLRAGALVCAWLAVGFCAVHPLLAFPWAIMAICLAMAQRLWPLMVLVLPFPLFLVSADLWRELVFQGVLPPDPLWWMPVKVLAMWPVACMCLALRPMKDRTVHIALGLLLVSLASLLFLSEPFAEPYFDRDVLHSSR